jgi:hypothetical protein
MPLITTTVRVHQCLSAVTSNGKRLSRRQRATEIAVMPPLRATQWMKAPANMKTMMVVLEAKPMGIPVRMKTMTTPKQSSMNLNRSPKHPIENARKQRNATLPPNIFQSIQANQIIENAKS